jgi:hypothetical protein
MSSSGFSELIEVRPVAARVWVAYGLGTALFAAAAVRVADVAEPGASLLVQLVGAGVAGCCWYRTCGPACVLRAVLRPDGSWHLFGKSGRPQKARLLRAWGRSGGAVIGLQWRNESGRCASAWLLRRDLPQPTWRRLRVRLRMP